MRKDPKPTHECNPFPALYQDLEQLVVGPSIAQVESIELVDAFHISHQHQLQASGGEYGHD
jgi:hypothetical protein